MDQHRSVIDEDKATAEARDRAGTALRRLGHALVGHDTDVELLERIARSAEEAAAEVEGGPRRSRPIEAIKRRLWEAPPADGGRMEHFPECVVSGLANPLGVALTVHREGDQVAAVVNLGAAFEGVPQRAHGGIVAAVFDDVMGYVLQLSRTPAYTGRLTVNYRAPVPLGTDLEVRGWEEYREGRKLYLRAVMTREGVAIGDAEGLFVAVPPERLGITPPTTGSGA